MTATTDISSLEYASAGLQTMSPAMTSAKNYYQWIADLVCPAVGQVVMDVGGGQGSLLRYFLDRKQLYALDIADDCVAALAEQFQSYQHVEAVLGDITTPEKITQFQQAGVDTILCTNVLEHVGDDQGMLAAFHQVLAKSNGQLALMVPAHQWLYGTMDKLAGHYRRYSKTQLRDRLEQAGFVVDTCHYMNFPATLGWWLNGQVRQVDSLGDAEMNTQIQPFDRWVIPAVRAVESIVSPPVGLSVLALARCGGNSKC